jgi:hypothetical protein
VEMYLWSAAGVLLTALVAWLRMLVLQHRQIARLGDRITHLAAGISLLTDTVESGMRDVALEIERLRAVKAASPKPKARVAAQRRVATAARRGRSVQDIAAKEKMSESEVRLRLQLGNPAGREKAHAEMR